LSAAGFISEQWKGALTTSFFAIFALWPAAFSSPVALQLAFGSGSWAAMLFRLLTAPSTPKPEA